MQSALYISALLLAVANAAPVDQRDSIGVSATQLAQFELFSQYSAAAYCYNNVHHTGAINCAAANGNCPLVETANVSIIESIHGYGFSKTLGYVAVDNTNKLIVVAIQGTAIRSNPRDILTDIDITPEKTSLCGTANKHDGCKIHTGFYRAMQDIQDIVNSTIATAKAEHPTYRIVVTGHSLGGAVAALLGAWLRNQGNIVDIYTYGQPHVGTVDISNYIQNQAPASGMNYRVTHYNDVVPQMPEHVLGHWDHYYPEFWISVKHGAVASTAIKVVNGSLYDKGGNEGQKSWFTWVGDIIGGTPAHREYFGPISRCSTSRPL